MEKLELKRNFRGENRKKFLKSKPKWFKELMATGMREWRKLMKKHSL